LIYLIRVRAKTIDKTLASVRIIERFWDIEDNAYEGLAPTFAMSLVPGVDVDELG
jgi:hypothetical protein